MLQLKIHSLRANAHVDGEGMISAVLKKDPAIVILCLYKVKGYIMLESYADSV